MNNQKAVEGRSHIVIVRDPETLGGIPIFAGTRVPIQTLIEYLERGFPLEEFLDDFPTVSLEKAIGVLHLAKEALLEYGYESVAG